MRGRAELAAALAAQAIGAGLVLLLATREWQTITTARPRPFADDVLGVSGRTLDGAPTAFALVALAGVVAVIATKGIVRRVIGALVALSGAGIGWRCLAALPALHTDRARALVQGEHPQVSGVQHVATHSVWGVLSVVAAVLVVAAGALIAVRGGRWAGLSSRYERSGVDPEQARARSDAALWSALESGDDPTARDPRDAR
ncbi:MAG: Trp biosynthesis-associated membrane protein [Jatrophihabitantaceae bacterium]